MADKLMKFDLKTYDTKGFEKIGKSTVTPIITDPTGKDIVDELRRLRVAFYATHDIEPKEDISIKALIADNDAYKEDIEEYKDRIKQLESDLVYIKLEYNKLSDDMNELLVNLINIFTDDNIPDDIDYREFIDMLCKALSNKKEKHSRFFKQNLLFHMYYGDIFTTKELKEYERQMGIG